MAWGPGGAGRRATATANSADAWRRGHCYGDGERRIWRPGLRRRRRRERRRGRDGDRRDGHGAMAQARSTAAGSSGEAQSTAQTNSHNVTLVQSTAVAQTGGTATTNAIAQAGSGPAFGNPGQSAYALSTGLPGKAYLTSLAGGAGNVVAALLQPHEVVFGTAILGANSASGGAGGSLAYSATSTFDFGYRGEVLLGLIGDQQSGSGFQSLEFYVLANGAKFRIGASPTCRAPTASSRIT